MLIPFMQILAGVALSSQFLSITLYPNPHQSLSKRLFNSLQFAWDVVTICVLINEELLHAYPKSEPKSPGGPEDESPEPPTSKYTLEGKFDNSTITAVWAINAGAAAVFPTPEKSPSAHSPMFPWTRGMFASTADYSKQFKDGIVLPPFNPNGLAFIEWPMLFLFLFLPNFIHHVLFIQLPSILDLVFGLYEVYFYFSFAVWPVALVMSHIELCFDLARLVVYLHVEGPPRLARVRLVVDRSLSAYEIARLLLDGSNGIAPDTTIYPTELLVSALLQAQDNFFYCLALKKFILTTEDKTANASQAKYWTNTVLDANHVIQVTLVTKSKSHDASVSEPAIMPWQPRSLSLFMVSHLVGIYLTPWEADSAVTMNETSEDVGLGMVRNASVDTLE
jgi:hypothetical protein